MYSFNVVKADLDEFMKKPSSPIKDVYARCGICDKTLLTFASGGAFSKYSHEFQTITTQAKTLFIKCLHDIAINERLSTIKRSYCSIIPGYKPGDEKTLETVKAVEVATSSNRHKIFKLLLAPKYLDDKREAREFIMGCYGMA